MIKGLDSIVKKILGDHQDINFRVSMLRYNLEVDTRPTLQGAKDLQQALLSELELQGVWSGRPDQDRGNRWQWRECEPNGAT